METQLGAQTQHQQEAQQPQTIRHNAEQAARKQQTELLIESPSRQSQQLTSSGGPGVEEASTSTGITVDNLNLSPRPSWPSSLAKGTEERAWSAMQR